MPRPLFPLVLRSPPSGDRKYRCIPPVGVCTVGVSGRIGQSILPKVSSPSGPPSLRSMSSTTYLTPVGMPISAAGQRVHQAVMMAMSLVASFRPCSVRGRLRPSPRH
jgi:hypothetical protein